MERFAFLIHPANRQDVARKFPIAQYLPEPVVRMVMPRLLRRPVLVSHIIGIRSVAGKEVEGWLIGLPFFPAQIMHLSRDRVYHKITSCAKFAADLGAKIMGLGAFSGVVGDKGRTVAQMLEDQNIPIAITTGNSLTVAATLEGIWEAMRLLEMKREDSKVAIVGATGSIGQACAHILSRSNFAELVLVGQNEMRLKSLALGLNRELIEMEITGPKITPTINISEALPKADVVLAVASSIRAIVRPEDLKPGALVCDVALPPNVSKKVVEQRNDVLVIGGGLMEVPKDAKFRFDFGLPPNIVYACVAETITLTLEGRYENFSLGQEIDLGRVHEIWELAQRHGITLAPLQSFGEGVTVGMLERVKEAKAKQAKRLLQIGGRL